MSGVSMNPWTIWILEKRGERRSNVTAVSGGTRGDVAVVTVRTTTRMDWVNYETSISLGGAFLGGMLNEPPWNNPWFIE